MHPTLLWAAHPKTSSPNATLSQPGQRLCWEDLSFEALGEGVGGSGDSSRCRLVPGMLPVPWWQLLPVRAVLSPCSPAGGSVLQVLTCRARGATLPPSAKVLPGPSLLWHLALLLVEKLPKGPYRQGVTMEKHGDGTGMAQGHAAAHRWLSPCRLTFLLLSQFPTGAGFWGAGEGGYPLLAAGVGGAFAVRPHGGRVLCSSSRV